MNLSPLPIQKFFDNNGRPLNGGLLFTYEAGTSTKVATYSDQAGTPNTNPIELNFRGEASVWLDIEQTYKFVLAPRGDTDPPGHPIWTVDEISVPITAADLLILITQSFIGRILWPRNTAEISVSVVPDNYAWIWYESPRYGAVGDGSTDDAEALQSMLDSAAAQSDSKCASVAKLTDATSKFYCGAGLVFDPQKVLFEGAGNTLNFTDVTGAFSGLKLSCTGENLNRTFLQHAVRGVKNVAIEMPSYTDNVDGVGIEIVDETPVAGDYRASGVPLENVSVLGGAYALKFGNGAWGSTIVNFSCGHDAGNTGGIGVYAPAPWTDGQECPKFLGGHISNRTQAFHFDIGSVKVIGMSIDGCPIIGYLAGTGELTFVGGYSEFTDSDNAQFKFECVDSNARIAVSDWEFVVRPDVLPSRTKPLFNNSGALFLRNLVFIGDNTQWYTPTNGGFLVEGAGAVYASGIIYRNFPWAPLVSKKLQWLAYPDCDNANVLAAFTLSNSGAFNPVRVTGVADGGGTTRDVVRFQINNGAAGGSYSRAVFTQQVEPGKRGTFCGQAFGALGGSNTRFEATTTHKDAAGNSLFTQTATIASTSIANYSTFGFDLGTFVPGAETVEVQIQLLATNTVSGNITWNVSPMAIGYADGQ